MPTIDLYYHRPGCVSCERTRAVLDASTSTVQSRRNAKKAPLTEADIADLLRTVSKVIIARGKSSRTLKAAETHPDQLRGPTGNFRAPMLKVGKTLLVGFNPDALDKLVGA